MRDPRASWTPPEVVRALRMEKERYLEALQAIMQHKFCGSAERMYECQTPNACREAIFRTAHLAVTPPPKRRPGNPHGGTL